MFLVVQFNSDTTITAIKRVMLEQLVHSPINYAHDIILSLKKALGNHTYLNITRPAVLRQYFGRESLPNNVQNNFLMCYNYG